MDSRDIMIQEFSIEGMSQLFIRNTQEIIKEKGIVKLIDIFSKTKSRIIIKQCINSLIIIVNSDYKLHDKIIQQKIIPYIYKALDLLCHDDNFVAKVCQ